MLGLFGTVLLGMFGQGRFLKIVCIGSMRKIGEIFTRRISGYE